MFIKKIRKIIAFGLLLVLSLANEGNAKNECAKLAHKYKGLLEQTNSYLIGYQHHLEDQREMTSQLHDIGVDVRSAHQSLDKSIRNISVLFRDIEGKLENINNMLSVEMYNSQVYENLLDRIEESTHDFMLNRLSQLRNRHNLKERASQLLENSVGAIFIESTAPSDDDHEVSFTQLNTLSSAELREKKYKIFAKQQIIDLYQIFTNSAIEFASLLDLRKTKNKFLKNMIRCCSSLWGPLSGASMDIGHPDYINDTYSEWKYFDILKNKEYLSNTQFPIPEFMKPRKVFQETKPVVDDWLEDTKTSSQKKAVKKPGKGSQKKSKQHSKQQQIVAEIADTKPSATEVVEIIDDVMPSEDVKVASEVAIAAPTQPTVSTPLKKASPQKQPSPERTVVAPVIQNTAIMQQPLTSQTNPLESRVLSLKASLQTVYYNIMNNMQFSYTNLCSLWTALGGTVLPAPGGGSHCKLKYGEVVIGGTFRPHGADGFGPRCRGDIKDIFNTLKERLVENK